MSFAIIGHVKHNLSEEPQNETVTGNKCTNNISSLSLLPLLPIYPHSLPCSITLLATAPGSLVNDNEL